MVTVTVCGGVLQYGDGGDLRFVAMCCSMVMIVTVYGSVLM